MHEGTGRRTHVLILLEEKEVISVYVCFMHTHKQILQHAHKFGLLWRYEVICNDATTIDNLKTTYLASCDENVHFKIPWLHLDSNWMNDITWSKQLTEWKIMTNAIYLIVLISIQRSLIYCICYHVTTNSMSSHWNWKIFFFSVN